MGIYNSILEFLGVRKPVFKIDWKHPLILMPVIKVKVFESGLDFYGKDGYLAFGQYWRNADAISPNWRKFVGQEFENR
jgi:hypothetical protein